MDKFRGQRLQLQEVPMFVMVGLLAGVVLYCVASALLVSLDFKYGLAETVVQLHNVPLMAFLLALAAAGLAGLAAVLVVYVAPPAAASGLPTFIAFLETSEDADDVQSMEMSEVLLQPRVILIKTLALLCSISSGMAIGREGPAITIGAGLGWFVADHVIRKTDVAERSYQEGLPQMLMVAGGAAGFAAAFQAPLGAILYLLEELVQPSGWTQRMTRCMFLSAAVAMLTVQSCLQLSEQSMHVSYSSVIIYDAHTTLTTLGWRYGDVPGFLVVALSSGALMGVLTKVGFRINRFRKTATVLASGRAKVLDAVCVAAFSALLFAVAPSIAGTCHHTPHDDDGGHDDSGGHHREFVQFNCNDDEYSDMASLTLVGEEGALVHLLARDGQWNFPPAILIVFMLIYTPCAVAALGTVVPAGTFVPMLLIGAALGRFVGEVIEEVPGIQAVVSTPGVYATIGAAASLGGFTRCTIAVVATVAEITGDLSLIAPMMVAVYLSRYVAASSSKEGYTHALLHLRIHAWRSGGSPKGDHSPDMADDVNGSGLQLPALEPSVMSNVMPTTLPKRPSELDMPTDNEEGKWGSPSDGHSVPGLPPPSFRDPLGALERVDSLEARAPTSPTPHTPSPYPPDNNGVVAPLPYPSPMFFVDDPSPDAPRAPIAPPEPEPGTPPANRPEGMLLGFQERASESADLEVAESADQLTSLRSKLSRSSSSSRSVRLGGTPGPRLSSRDFD